MLALDLVEKSSLLPPRLPGISYISCIAFEWKSHASTLRSVSLLSWILSMGNLNADFSSSTTLFLRRSFLSFIFVDVLFTLHFYSFILYTQSFMFEFMKYETYGYYYHIHMIFVNIMTIGLKINLCSEWNWNKNVVYLKNWIINIVVKIWHCSCVRNCSHIWHCSWGYCSWHNITKFFRE